jgi:hypothetical protein
VPSVGFGLMGTLLTEVSRRRHLRGGSMPELSRRAEGLHHLGTWSYRRPLHRYPQQRPTLRRLRPTRASPYSEYANPVCQRCHLPERRVRRGRLRSWACPVSPGQWVLRSEQHLVALRLLLERRKLNAVPAHPSAATDTARTACAVPATPVGCSAWENAATSPMTEPTAGRAGTAYVDVHLSPSYHSATHLGSTVARDSVQTCHARTDSRSAGR